MIQLPVVTRRSRFGRPLLLCLFLFPLARTDAAELTQLMDNGPNTNRVDLVFLGDGYTAEELASDFHPQLQRVLDHWFGGSEEFFTRYGSFFNIYRVDVASNESGVSDAVAGIQRDTALGATFGNDGHPERVLKVNSIAVIDAVSDAIQGNSFRIDGQLISVNTSRFGGSGGGRYSIYSGDHAMAGEIALHEFAHTFAGLADEYVVSNALYDGPEPREPNVTTSPDGEKWSHWLGYEQPSIGTIGVYQGARYFGDGLYRPSTDSKMRTLGRPFDAVSREQLVLAVYDFVDPLDEWSDNRTPLYNAEVAWVDPVDAEVIEVKWLLDGEPLPNFDRSASLDLLALREDRPRTFELTAIATDPTDWVRVSRDRLTQSVTWTVTLNPGDLNQDQRVDVADIQELNRQIASHTYERRFDYNQDDLLDHQDRTHWVETLARTYFGDSNLDGQFDSSDLVRVFVAGEYEDSFAANSTWQTGDWNGDFEFDTTDFVLAFIAGGYEMGPRTAVGVPEPPAVRLGFAAAVGLLAWARVLRWR